MASVFLLISEPLRTSVLSVLSQAILLLWQFSPWSYIAVALTVSICVIKSLAPVKPQ